MTIEILNGGAGREVNAGILANVLLKGCTIKANHPFVRFDVPSWPFFCGIVYHTYCEFSKDWRGRYISGHVPVKVIMEDGRVFFTEVWCDVENKCLRYVSLY